MIPTVLEREFKEFDIDMEHWKAPKPFGFSGCFRVCNDAEFLEESILSHLPYLDEVVIALQPSTDGTEENAYRLADTYEKVRVVKYPVKPHFIDVPEFHTDPENSIYSFVYLSNWALSLCKYSWIAKTEADVVCLPSFQKVIDIVKANPKEAIYYGRVILNLAGRDRDKFSLQNPRNGGWDECVIPNHPSYFFHRSGKWETIGMGPKSLCMGFSALHMKRCKADKADGWNGETYVDLTVENLTKALAAYGGIDPDGPEIVEKLIEWVYQSAPEARW